MDPPVHPPKLDAAAIVAALNRHGVRFVVIGAFAAIAQRTPMPATRDIDLTPERSRENLTRLSSALRDLGARVRTTEVPNGLSFDHDGASLGAVETWNLVCAQGEFDIAFSPTGIAEGYAELALRAHHVKVDEVDVLVADLDDVIRSKEAAGRPKDLLVLPLLYEHRARRRSRGDEPSGSDR